ncbi:MAG: PIN domain-containing protein [Dinghuibacter sp.]|nr:PIN domain-containing protein [Dinghuibacter sp.]
MNIFLDANVLVAILNKELPVYDDAVQVLSLADRPGYRVFTSPLCMAIAWYFASKKSGSALAKQKIALLNERVFLSEHHQHDVGVVCQNRRINDVEDGLEYYSALRAGCRCIVSEDADDFHFSELPVFNCRGFLVNYFSRKS